MYAPHTHARTHAHTHAHTHTHTHTHTQAVLSQHPLIGSIIIIIKLEVKVSYLVFTDVLHKYDWL